MSQGAVIIEPGAKEESFERCVKKALFGGGATTCEATDAQRPRSKHKNSFIDLFQAVRVVFETTQPAAPKAVCSMALPRTTVRALGHAHARSLACRARQTLGPPRLLRLLRGHERVGDLFRAGLGRYQHDGSSAAHLVRGQSAEAGGDEQGTRRAVRCGAQVGVS